MLIGYARVSTNDQDTALQLDALREAGVRKVYAEKTSSVGKRPQLAALLERIKAGDVLVVWKLDRLARSLGDFLGILEALRERGAGLRSLTEPIDTSSAMGVCGVSAWGSRAARAQHESRAIHCGAGCSVPSRGSLGRSPPIARAKRNRPCEAAP